MTCAECYSTTDISFEDISDHAPGCTRINTPCTSSLLRLALIAGSDYAVQFTTCFVDINFRRREKCKERTRVSPYQIKKKYAVTTRLDSTKNRPQEISVQIVSSSTDSITGILRDDTSVESTTGKDCVKQGTADSLHLTELPTPFEDIQNLMDFSDFAKAGQPC